MNNKILLILITIANSFLFSHAQFHEDPLYSIENEHYEHKTYFLGFHGYYLTSAEIIPVHTDLFKKLISNDSIPTVDLSPAFTLGWLSFMRNWMFTSLSYSYTMDKEEENDSLKSRITQYSIATRFGYNLIKKQKVVVSPYIGFRYTRFRHLTNMKEKKISLDDYLKVRELDLRVSQFSGAVGINSTFTIKNMWSVGLYVSYLIDLHNYPIIRTKGNRITNQISSPMDNFVIGIGLGIGFNDFYNRHRETKYFSLKVN